ncbi:MAG: flagellar biosynthesis anti-sigma factor FlgM [Polaromonas sp.]|uniref:flagellar biosynthesis anti-sigma factor FlgM n=1 Tax=Polaromonas sp. TaxID=1869339 RepID=UPI00272537B2|nr:flagellar biosynthesis anti-sigma factor FlgM [Polaromonas sp.]MDO9116297.1 flagellar biosynthesis anti-sigma factor FlgM [Polaromonas sp.]MDP1887956.1 flagellar biosynthesis anti-sigma factor FlgM [Polaromonas sp.]
MKINQNVTFLKNAADSPAVPARDGVKPNRAVSGMPAEAAQTRPAAATPLLPSTNGDFDAARVGKIREDISAGRYHVDTEKIADGLLRSVRDLLGEKAP